MNPRARSGIFAAVAIVAGVGGWLVTLWAASDRWAGAAFLALVVLLIAAAFRGRFAAEERARDFWTGFALFGLVQMLVLQPMSGFESMTEAIVDRIGDLVLGPENHHGRPDRDLTPLGLSLAKIPVETYGGQIWSYLSYLRDETKRFATLPMGLMGGIAAVHLRRKSIRLTWSPRLGGLPPLGIAWLVVLAGLIGGVFAFHVHPDLIFPGFFAESPGSEAANFALFNIEVLAVLFAALEARFAAEVERPWWFGFSLLGGFHLLTLHGSYSASLPNQWAGELFQGVYLRFISESAQPFVSVRGRVLEDQVTSVFFRSSYAWAPLAMFLPVVWLGTLASRLAVYLGTTSTWPNWLDRWRIRSAIGRSMLGLAVIGLILAAIANPTQWGVRVEASALMALILFASLRAAFGPDGSRAWWWGFALVGGVDLIIGAQIDHQGFSPEQNLWSWPIHGWMNQLHHQGFERHVGQTIPVFAVFDSPDEPDSIIQTAYYASKALVLMTLCLPMGWVGAILARRIDRRR